MNQENILHGLKTIVELNNLAAENAQGVPEQRLAEAEAVNALRGPTPFDKAYAESKERNRQERERAVANLSARSSSELISLARANNSLPSTLETALANRLEQVEAVLASHNESHAALIV